MKRSVALAASALFVLVLFAPTIASAQFSGFDPAGAVQQLSVSNNWLGQAQTWAQRIYVTLMVFELFALGVTTLLFRDNMGEFFAGVTLKIVMGGVFFWFIANSGVAGFPGQVVATFTHFGQQLGGNATTPAGIAAEGLASAAGYFGAVEAARIDDDAVATALDVPPNCTFIVGNGDCFVSPAFEALTAHAVFEVVVSAMGVMIIMAIAAIFLEVALVTIESYLVMTAGTLFIGFAGSRFTMPFSQGYFSYMVNVGVKLMTVYIILGVEGPLLGNILTSSFATLLASAADPTGASMAIALATAGYGVFSVIIGAALIWTIPGFASSFLTGQSNASGSAVLSQALSSVAGSAQMMAQAASSRAHLRNAATDMRGGGAANESGATRAATEQMAPASAVPGGGMESFQPASAAGGESVATNATTDALGMANQPPRITVQSPPAIASSREATALSRGGDVEKLGEEGYGWTAGIVGEAAAEGLAPRPVRRLSSEASIGEIEPAVPVLSPEGELLNTESGAPARSGGSALYDLSPELISALAPPEARRYAAATELKHLSAEQLTSLRDNKEFAREFFAAKRQEAAREVRSAELATAYGLGGLAQAAEHDIGVPTAVEVRLGNPDRL